MVDSNFRFCQPKADQPQAENLDFRINYWDLFEI